MMFYRIVVISTLIIVGVSCLGQNTLIPFYKGGLCGYYDNNLEVVIQPKFESGEIFHRGAYAPVMVNGRYGVIDDSGRYILKPKFDTIYSLSIYTPKERLILVGKGGKSRYYTLKGKRRYPSKFIGQGGCGNGLNRICMPKMDHEHITDHIRDTSGYRLLTYTYRRDSSNRLLTEYDTLATVFDSIVQFDKTKFVFINDSTFAIVDYEQLYGSTEDVQTNLTFDYDAYQLFPCERTLGVNWFSRYIALRKAGKWGIGFIATNGIYKTDIVIFPKYMSVINLEKGFLFVEYAENKYGYVSCAGKEYWK